MFGKRSHENSVDGDGCGSAAWKSARVPTDENNCGDADFPTSSQGSNVISATETRVFNDPVHGDMKIPELCIGIIDTPQFQRLRRICQSSSGYLVYSGACHNRFEHCLGVCHLAGVLLESLKNELDKLSDPHKPTISDKDILCVQIAGLCHDLGHGPYSHMFDGVFIPMARPDVKWKHEDASVAMFDYLLAENPAVKADLVEIGGLTEIDFIFIKELIKGPLGDSEHVSFGDTTSGNWPYDGRGSVQSFLYQIVSNKFNGIDVDKFEYMARDAYQLHVPITFSHERYIDLARILYSQEDGLWHICIRDKEVNNMYDLFQSRARLHRCAYQHKTGISAGIMMVDALLKANDFIHFYGRNGRKYRLSESVDDMSAFVHTDDGIISYILNYTLDDPRLEPARNILHNLQHRRIYPMLGESVIQPPVPYKAGINMVIMAEMMELKDTTIDPSFELDDFVVFVSQIDFGMHSDNPISRMYFYRKNDNRPFRIRSKLEVSPLLPEHLCEAVIRVFSRSSEENVQLAVLDCFKKWCALKHYPPPKRSRDMFTPLKSDASANMEPPRESTPPGII